LYRDGSSILPFYVLCQPIVHIQKPLPKDNHLLSINISNSILGLIPYITLLPHKQFVKSSSEFVIKYFKGIRGYAFPFMLKNIIQEIISLENAWFYPALWRISINGTNFIEFEKFKRIKRRAMISKTKPFNLS
jgi:hypothetical protein